MRKRIISALLSIVMLVGLLPTTVFAATPDSGNSDLMKVFHLDCGRKYFSVGQIKDIIDTLEDNDYNYLELAVGNDGLRFLLEDMSLSYSVDGADRSFTSDAVKAGIQAGNKSYYDAGTNELTQTEMDTIISYARGKGISIIPLINTPGHMNAILSAAESLTGKSLSYNGSNTTINVTNTEAVAFTQTLLQKYIAYFADSGCEYFNMGADEYAGSSVGFDGLQSNGMYDDFITYINTVAEMVEDARMTPMAFNDGIYYNNVKNQGTIDTNIIVCYWDGGGKNRSAANLAKDGFDILNTNAAWYYVLGRDNYNWAGLYTAQNGVQNTKWNSISGVDPVGSMVCVWCDQPDATYGIAQENNVKGLISTFAKNNPDIFTANTDPDIDPNPGTDPDPDTDPVEVTERETVELTVGETASRTIAGYDFSGTYTPSPTGIATVTVTGQDAQSETVTPVTSLESGSTYYIKSSDGKYLNENGKFVNSRADAAQWKINSYYDSYNLKNNENYLRYYNGSWTTSNRNFTQLYFNEGTLYRTRKDDGFLFFHNYTYSDPLGQPVTVSEGTAASTEVSFTGEAVGTAKVTVGNTEYTIHVTKDTQTVSLTEGGSKSYPDSASTYTVTSGSGVVDVALSGGNITFTGIAAGTATVETAGTVYTITVTEEDFDEVNPIRAEYWCTSMQLTSGGSTYKELTA